MWSISLELILWFHKSYLYSSGSYSGLQLMCIYGWEGWWTDLIYICQRKLMNQNQS